MSTSSNEDKVTIHVKACPPKTRPDCEFLADSPPVESIGEAEVERSWLKTPYFEAVERWQNNGSELVMHIPYYCDAIEGARLLRLRLYSDVEHEKCSEDVIKEGGLGEGSDHSDPSDLSRSSQHSQSLASDKEDAWSRLQWWRISKGRLPALAAALHLFDLALFEKYAKEVARTLQFYRIPCPKPVVTMADGFNIAVVPDNIEALAQPIPVRVAKLKEMLREAMLSNDESLKFLAARAIAGSRPFFEDFAGAVVDTYFSVLSWEVPLVRVSGYGNPTTPRPLGYPLNECSQQQREWLIQVLEAVVREYHDVAIDIVKRINDHFSKLPTSYRLIRHHDCDSSADEESAIPLPLSPQCCELTRNLLVACVHTLLIESGRPDSCAPFVLREMRKRISDALGAGRMADDFRQGVRLCPYIFAVGSRQAQLAWLQEPIEDYVELRDHIHLVHEGARHVFLGNTSRLSPGDKAFLSTATFPGLESRQ